VSFAEDMRKELEAARTLYAAPMAGDGGAGLQFRSFLEDPQPMDMVAVDGSYSFLLNISSWRLAMISVALLRYSFAKEHFAKKDWRMIQRVVGIDTYEDYVERQGEFYRNLYEFTRGAKEQHREMVNEWRRFIEGQLAVNVAEDTKGCIIAVDGALSTFPKQFDFIGRLVEVCERNGHLLVGVSKDSQLHAFGHSLTDEDLLKSAEGSLEDDALAFIRAPEKFEKGQRGLLYGDVYYCRFHPRSGKWFRVDLGTMKGEPEKAFGHVAPYCRSLLAVGYPLPLVEAHRMAVTVRHLRGAYQETVMRLAVRMGMNPRQVLDGLTEIEGRKRSAFHEYLDRLSRDRR